MKGDKPNDEDDKGGLNNLTSSAINDGMLTLLLRLVIAFATIDVAKLLEGNPVSWKTSKSRISSKGRSGSALSDRLKTEKLNIIFYPPAEKQGIAYT